MGVGQMRRTMPMQIVAAVLLALSSVPRADGLVKLDALSVFYTGKNDIYPIPVTVSDAPSTATEATIVQIDFNSLSENTSYVIPVENYTSIATAAAAGAGFEVIFEAGTGTAQCMPAATVIEIFKLTLLLPCSLTCKKDKDVLTATLREFAGRPEYAEVLSRFNFPVPFCLLGNHYTASVPPSLAATVLSNLQFISPSLVCPSTYNIPTRLSTMGCDSLTIGLTYNSDKTASDTPPKETAVPLVITSYITPITPNRPPVVKGLPGHLEIELSKEISILPLSLEDRDANEVKVSIHSNEGLVRISDLRVEIPSSVKEYVIPEFVPVFTSGAYNVSSPALEFTSTVVQATRALASLHFTPTQLGFVFLVVTVDDLGQTGFPAQADTLNQTLTFNFTVKPSMVPPNAEFINSDETFRIDWKPGMQYMKAGQTVTIHDDFFACGGDVLRGRFDFSRNSTGEGPFGWSGAPPPGVGSSEELKRDCQHEPFKFWKQGERSHYVTLDEGGKQRTFIQMRFNESGCETSTQWRVTMAIQNANYSRTDIPEARRTGFHMDWFECRAGAWYCEQRNPYMSLDNSTGAVGRLKFWYDQQHRHLGDGHNDYRMTFTGEYADIRAALSNITVTFPWLDLTYDGSGKIVPYPFVGWPRTGRTLYGSNILRVRIEDVPGEFTYDERANRMWMVRGLYMIQKLGSISEAKAVCDMDQSCYGFQWLTTAQLQAIANTVVQQIPSVGLGATSGMPFLDPGAPFIPAQGFADVPPASWGQGNTTWDELNVQKFVDWQSTSSSNMPNAFFFRKPFDELDIHPFQLNAATFTKKPNPKRCLGDLPFEERMLDIRVLQEPINMPPILTAEKPIWRIQRSYEFPLAGIKLWDEDASRYSGNMQVTATSSRGGFTNPNLDGLTFVVGVGNKDPITQTFLCSYVVCRRAVSEIRYQSADEQGEDFVRITVNDLGNSGDLGAQSGSVTVSLSLAAGPYNVAPTVNIPGLPDRVAKLNERVDITGIYVEDLDMDKPRWDKLYPEGLMTVWFSLGTGYMDITRLRRYGMRGTLFLGPADGGTDPDCPCLTVNNTCPCNGFRMTTYFKVSGRKVDVKWVVQEVSVWMFVEGTTQLRVTVSDNCNTGFSDDSGVQLPCLTATHSVVIRTIIDVTGPRFLYVDPGKGRDVTSGTVVAGTSDSVTLGQDASAEDNAYSGLTMTLSKAGVEDEKVAIGVYSGANRTATVFVNYVRDTSFTYSINCGTDLAPCGTLQAVINEAGEYGIIRALPGIYSGVGNTNLDMPDKTIDIGSTAGFNQTLIDCGWNSSVAVFAPTKRSRVRLEGFSIRNCLSKRGGAMVMRAVMQRRVNQIDGLGLDASACTGLDCVASPLIVKCYFFDNAASSLGGAVYISEGRPVFEDCIFFGNVANSGGGVYVRGGEPTFKRCVFYGNVAEIDGGALVFNGGRTRMEGCNFSLNAATTNGGAVSVIKGEVQFVDCFLITNYAGAFDGGVHSVGGRVSYQNVVQDGNDIGHHSNTLLQDIQARRQNTLYTSSGFAPQYIYQQPGGLELDRD